MARSDIDEVVNDDLATMTPEDVAYAGWDLPVLIGEARRIGEVIDRLVLTGEDLTYWNERARIVSNLGPVK